MESEMGDCKSAGSASQLPAKVNQIRIEQLLLDLPPVGNALYRKGDER
jgi:hypothetical protein